MTDTKLYFGAPGAQIEIPHPRGGVQSTRNRPTTVFPTGTGGARVSRSIEGKRQYVLNWQQLWYETYATIEAYHHGHNGPGPFVLHDPARTNWLTVNQSGATSHRNDTDGFSLAASGSSLESGLTFNRGPRSLEWVLDPWVTLWDNYTPTGSGGWGTADSGQAWSIDPSSTGGGIGYVRIEDGWGTIAPPSPGNSIGMQISASIPGAWSAGQTLVKLGLDLDTLVGDGLGLPGTSGAYASTPDASGVDITGDLDVRVDVTLPSWNTGAEQSLVSKWVTTSNQRSYRLFVDTDGTLCFARSTDGIVTGATAEFNSTVAPTIPGTNRLSVRAIFDSDNGAAGSSVTFYTSTDSDLTNATWTQLGSVVTKAGTSTIFNSSSAVEVGSQQGGTLTLVTGTVHSIQLYASITGATLRRYAQFGGANGPTTGATSFADSADTAVTWTVNGTAFIKPPLSHLVRWPGPSGVGAITATLLWVADNTLRLQLSTSAGSDVSTLSFTRSEAGSSGVWVRTDHTTTLARAKAWPVIEDEPEDFWDVDLVLSGGVQPAVNVVSLFGSRHAAGSTLNNGVKFQFDDLEVAFGGLTSQNSAFILDSAAPAVWPGIPVVATVPLVFQALAKLSAATGGTSIRAQLEWLDEDGVTLSTTSGSTVPLSNSSWLPVSATATPPANAVYVVPRFALVGASEPVSIFMDEFQLERGSTATDWRPGTGVQPVSVVSFAEAWPWQASDYRNGATLTLQETGP